MTNAEIDSGDSPTQTGSPERPSPDHEDEVPVCLTCLTPHSPLQHFCDNCGETVGRLSPYIPYLNIPYNYSIFGRMWRRTWIEEGVPIGWRIFYMLLIIGFVPFMLIGLPFLLISKLRRKPLEGHCVKCGYNLTGNVSGVCPECGTEIPKEAGDEE